MSKYFGTDGFRGEAGITLTADHAYKVGRFLGWYYNALRERNGDSNPARIVIGKDTRRSSYIQYVMECLKSNTTQVRNIKQYLLATLYNAPTTIDSYYAAQVRHDFGWGGRSN